MNPVAVCHRMQSDHPMVGGRLPQDPLWLVRHTRE